MDTLHTYDEYISLLRSLIQTPSFSKGEDKTADILAQFLRRHTRDVHRQGNNVWTYNTYFDVLKPTLLLNSHHDTVKPNPAYTRDPFSADIEGNVLYGLGSNDAGGCLVALLATFLHFREEKNLAYNLCFAATAEEEISGHNGIESVLPQLRNIQLAIVGEPTQMDMAIAERGLIVLDCVAHGKAGHAARNEGVNAIYKAMQDINWFKTFRFPKESDALGPISMNVTQITAGSQHNVVPATCHYTVDIRVTDAYSNEEMITIIKQHVSSSVEARSLRLSPSSISIKHPLVQAGLSLGRKTYGSPTMSDQALLRVPSIKIGPGDSARSHTADEFIYIPEIAEGIDLYKRLLAKILYS